MATALVAIVLGVGGSGSGDPAVWLGDAKQAGVFNVGASTARLATVDSDLILTFHLPPGTAAGVWSKEFPPALRAGAVDLIRSSVVLRGEGPGGPPVDVALEIKGSAGTQKVPLAAGDAPAETAVDWRQIGEPTEVVVSVVPRAGELTPLDGEVQLDVGFAPLSWRRKLAEAPWARIAVALWLAATVAGPMALRVRAKDFVSPNPRSRAARSGWRDDLARGLGLVATVALAVGVFDLGAWPVAAEGWWYLLLGLGGGVVAGLWSYTLAGQHLSPGEWGRDLAISGLLAGAASPFAILQVPEGWGDALRLSQTAAAAAFLIYHLANARSLANSGRHLGTVAGGLIAATPFVFGGLVLLSADSFRLVGQLGDWVSFGLLRSETSFAAEAIGRVVVLWGFNEAIAAGLGLATKGRVAGSVRLHLILLAASVVAVLAPWAADAGSSRAVAEWAGRWEPAVAVLAAAVSAAGLWTEVYLVTGLLLDAAAGFAPTGAAGQRHSLGGMGKGLVYAGVFMALLRGVGLVVGWDQFRNLATAYPYVVAVPVGVLVFPLIKTIIETFDGSQGFFRRLARSYRDPRLYVRGAVVGLGLGLAAGGVPAWSIGARALFGFGFGALAYAGVNLANHLAEAPSGRGQVQPVRVYLVQALLGGFIGAAVGFYFDAVQVGVVVDKFGRYLAGGQAAEPFDVRPFLSKWGRVDLGMTTGGVKLLFDESLAGVISWAVPAWLFAINRTFLAAYFAGEAGPIRGLFTREGRSALGRNMIEVLRWGLWMSPIINSFLRPMGQPTWYNQDGAIRTLFAIGHDATESTATFQSWSLGIFTALLAYDSLRILIWLDHMGLRVATLVNLSFLGMDRLDERLARFIAPASTARCIPEGVKRFTTWAPLLIPFYIPRGHDWDVAWEKSGAGHPPAVVTLAEPLLHWPMGWQLGAMVGLVGASSAGFGFVRWLKSRRQGAGPVAWTLENPEYAVTVEPSGAVTSQIKSRGFDLTRRSYDTLDPAGRALFLVFEDAGRRQETIIGQFPGGNLAPGGVIADGDSIRFGADMGLVEATVTVTLPDPAGTVELWTIDLTSLADSPLAASLVPYLEWVLNRPDADRGHTQYNRLFAEMEYVPGLHAVLAWDKHAKALGFVASDLAPAGFLTSRMDFIGRARSLRSPRALETLAFSTAGETEAHPTFDPIAALRLDLNLMPGTQTVRLLVGYAPDKAGAIAAIARHLAIPGAEAIPADRQRKALHSIGHGEIPPGTPQPYSEFTADGRTLRVLTPFTPRPYDHVLSNALGHVVALTNRGFQTTSSGNSQQNRLTPDWPDTVTREVPPEAFYLHDPATGEWFSPTYHPLNDPAATYETDFGVDGTATYRMSKGDLSTELTVFVPPDLPAGFYHLTIRNGGNAARTLRVGSYFQVVLAAQPEAAGALKIRRDAKANALFFENPRNHFREGPAFAAVSAPPDAIETSRGRFFGPAGDVTRPAFVAHPAEVQPTDLGPDDRPVAAFLNTLTVAAGGSAALTVVLGQSDDRRGIAALLRDLKDVPADACRTLARTRAWWDALMDTVRVETASPEFDRYLDWIKYQALAERIWARRGFYQSSGAFGFRDQLQDSVNLLWMDPSIARKQILLHASQQFLEGDVVHWFHRLDDGRTGFVARTHASDNLLWLSWGVVEYVAATGDLTILDESTPYLEAELPFGPLPKDKGGMGFDPLRSSRADTVYWHCLKAIDLVLDRKMGAHGLPLIGTGDWNDGLDEIGSEGRGESVWLGFFLHYILRRMANIVGQKEGEARQDHYLKHLRDLGEALESTWRDDRYLRAIHDDGTEIGVKGSGIWEIDALTAAWAVMADINPVARPDRLRDGARRPGEGHHHPPRLASLARGHPPLPRPEQRLPRRGPRERDVLPRRPVARRRRPHPGRAGHRRRPPRRRRPLRRGGLSPLAQDRGHQPRYPRPDRDLRRPAQQAVGRHGHHLRPRPDDLARLHRRCRLDVPPGDRGRPRLPPDRRHRPPPVRSAGRFRAGCGPSAPRPRRQPVWRPNPANHRGDLIMTERPGEQGGRQAWAGWVGWLVAVVAAWGQGASESRAGDGAAVADGHKYARQLLDNALRYADPAQKLVDPVSGYPVEGWNQDPSRGLFLRSFTQLTAIGQYMELLGNVAAGRADSPGLGRDAAVQRLTHLVRTLRQDQGDPKLAAKGLLGNFLDLATGKRLGPLASDVDKGMILRAVGDEPGTRLWQALTAAGWIAPRHQDLEAEIRRGPRYGYQYFEGPLLPFADSATKTKVMDILDRRVVMIIFGDNSNLTASAAKTIGTLLEPSIRDRPEVAAIRADLEAFLDAQRPGYERLYDVRGGLFYFGWDATRDRLFGWEDPNGDWTTGHMDYLDQRVPRPGHVHRRPVRSAAGGDRQPRVPPQAGADGRGDGCLCPGPVGRLGVPGAGAVADAQRGEAAGVGCLARQPGRHRGGLRPTAPAPRLPVRVVYRRRRPVHRERRHPGDHGCPEAADYRRRVALHPRRRLLARAEQARSFPRRELARDHPDADRAWPLGRLQRPARPGHPVPDDRAHPGADPRSDRARLGRHGPLPR